MRRTSDKDNIDRLDIEILRVLQKNGRLSWREVARAINVSAGTVSKRAQALIDAGVIRKFTAIIDPTKVGKKISLFVFVRIHAGKPIIDIINDIEKIDESCCIHNITGVYDLHLLVRVKDNHEASELLDKLRRIEGIERVDSHIILKSFKPFYEAIL